MLEASLTQKGVLYKAVAVVIKRGTSAFWASYNAPQNLYNIALRGLGTGGGSESYDQSVGLFIDGVYSGRLREFQAGLFDLERIEVIKGTQNSLLGKNTSE